MIQLQQIFNQVVLVMFLNFDGASVFSNAKYATHKSENDVLNIIYTLHIQHICISL